MPPKRSARAARSATKATQEQTSPTSLQGDSPTNGGPVPAKKRLTTAENAKAIQGMQAELSTMAGLLTTLTTRLCPDSPADVPTIEGDPENYTRPRGRTADRHQDPHRTWSGPSTDRQQGSDRDRHPSAPPRPAPAPWTTNQQDLHTSWFGAAPTPSGHPHGASDPRVPRPGFRPY